MIFRGIKDITITQELLTSQDKNGHLLKLQRDLECKINAIRRLSDVVQPATERDAVLSEGEEFEMDVDMSHDSDSNGEHPEKKEQVSSTCPIHI
jgi:hypothetical protein